MWNTDDEPRIIGSGIKYIQKHAMPKISTGEDTALDYNGQSEDDDEIEGAWCS